MGGYKKMDKKAKKAARQAQNAAYRAKRQARGLRTVTVWTAWPDNKNLALIRVSGDAPAGLLEGESLLEMTFDADSQTASYEIVASERKAQKDPRQVEFSEVT